MNSRERLLKTLRREPVDRVPVSTYELMPLGGDVWYQEQPSYKPLLDYIAEKTDILYMWGPGAKNSCEWEEKKEHWAEGDSTFMRYTVKTANGDLTRVTRRDKDVNTNWEIEPLFKSIEDLEAYYALPWEYAGVDMASFHEAEAKVGDRGIILCDTFDPVCEMAGGFDFEPFMIHAWQDRSRMRKCMDVVLERLLIDLRAKLEGGAGPIWRIYGPEYVTPPYFPPDAFRELVIAYDKPIIDLIHEYGGLARVHSHGRVSGSLDLFVEMGADATDPLEPPPQGDVDLAEVKKKYGDRLILFGNIELSYLEYWEPDEIERYVKESIDAAAEGGGFVVMPTAAPINAPLWDRTAENYRRMIDTVLEYGRYD